MPHSSATDLAEPSHSTARQQWTILLTMYVGYTAFMLCRNTLIASSATMIQDPAIGLDKESFGQLMSWHSAGAIAGKLVTGICADKIGGRRMFLIALGFTAAANLGFAFCSSFFLMGVLNFLGQFFKAGGWPAMTKIVGAWFRPRRYGQVWSILATSSRVGTIAAGIVVGWLLLTLSWRTVFVITAIVTAVIVAVAYFFLKEESEAPTELSSDVGAGMPVSPHRLDEVTLGQACLQFIKSARFWLICFSVVFLTILMDFINFIPIFLAETLSVDGGRAGMAATVFPAGMFVALIANGLVYDRLSRRQVTWTLGGLLLLCCGCVVTLWNLGNLPFSSSMQLNVALAVIFVMGFSIAPAYYIPHSIFAIDFGGKHSGFLTASIDIFGYSGALLFNFFGGSIAQRFGWSVFLTGLLAITLLAFTCMTGFLTLDARGHSRTSKSST